jgi:hypothetical protein
MLVVPDEGEIRMLKYIVNNATPADLTLRLFTTNIPPDENTTIGMIAEAAAAGYSPVTLSGANWTFATVNNVTTASYPAQTFNISGSLSAYGYYITLGTSALMWIERFPNAPFVLPVSGGTITVTPRISLD